MPAVASAGIAAISKPFISRPRPGQENWSSRLPRTMAVMLVANRTAATTRPPTLSICAGFPGYRPAAPPAPDGTRAQHRLVADRRHPGGPRADRLLAAGGLQARPWPAFFRGRTHQLHRPPQTHRADEDQSAANQDQGDAGQPLACHRPRHDATAEQDRRAKQIVPSTRLVELADTTDAAMLTLATVSSSRNVYK